MRVIRQNFLSISLINAIALLVLLGRTVAAEDLADRTIVHNPQNQTVGETNQDWSIDTSKGAENNQDKGELTTTTSTSNVPLVKEDLGKSPALETNSSPSELSDATPSLLEQIQEYSNETGADDTLEQVTDVSQLRDVRPGDWAYEALRSLVEKYGAIAGYPDGTFRGNRAITRYEFAAALVRVFDQIQLLLVRGEKPDPNMQADLATLRQLTQGFVTEISLLRGKVDGITARTEELNLTQFSITTKLQGEAILGFATIATGDDANSNNVDDVDILGHRTRLNLETSFTGRDLLLTRLQAEGLGSLESRTLTPEGELAFTGATDNNVQLDTLLYRFPVGDRTTVVIAATTDDVDEFADTVNPYFDGDGASGALSRFATRPPIYYLVSGAGVGVKHSFSDKLEVSLGYLAGDANDADTGLFNGSYGALAQVVVQPSDRLTLGLTYVHAYNQYLQTGSNSANLLGLPAVSNSYGIEASYQINPRFVVGGWVGYTAGRVIEQGDANIWNWALTLAIPDLGKAGNLAGFLIGMEPKVTGSDGNLKNLGIDDPSTSLHLEAFYQYRLSDYISITPGIIWLTAPNHNSDNSDAVIGTVRTTFRF